MSAMSIVVSGFLIGLSLIIAIGPQNAFIIKQGIKREYVGLVVAVCALSDIALVFGGTAGVGVLIERAPVFLEILKWAGIAYLSWFGYTCFRDAFKRNSGTLTVKEDIPTTPSDELVHGAGPASQVATITRPRTRLKSATAKPWFKVALTALAFTWLNPGAYIDAVIMLGGMANQYGPDGRWVFAFGVLCASALWFPTVGFGSAKFSHVLARPAVWRVINFAIGCIMVMMCIKLLMH